MTEPLRTDPAAVPGAPAAADQAARIEQLLVSGLDEYFAGHYEQAINIWTRVVFLQRGHSRARAYIERARSAMAERQRESEELLHRGVAAFDAGDMPAARDLLMKAVEQGSAGDEALAFLQRVNRVEAAASVRDLTTPPAAAAAIVSPPAHAAAGRWVRPVLVAAIVFGGVALGAAPLVSWIIELRAGVPSASPARLPEALPVVRLPETRLVQARHLYAGGHLIDALRLLERIDVGDPLRADADQLRGEIQRELLAVAARGRDDPAALEPGR
jgi:hypothetical protein